MIAVCSEIYRKHINALCGQNVKFLMLHLMVYKITKRLTNVECKPVTVEKKDLLLNISNCVYKTNQLLAHFASFSVNFIFCKQTCNYWRTNV